MHAAAEAEMAVRLAADVVDIGIGEAALVAIARAVGEADEIAALHHLPVQLGVFAPGSGGSAAPKC